jgi:hypothetical protein
VIYFENDHTDSHFREMAQFRLSPFPRPHSPVPIPPIFPLARSTLERIFQQSQPGTLTFLWAHSRDSLLRSTGVSGSFSPEPGRPGIRHLRWRIHHDYVLLAFGTWPPDLWRWRFGGKGFDLSHMARRRGCRHNAPNRGRSRHCRPRCAGRHLYALRPGGRDGWSTFSNTEYCLCVSLRTMSW